MGRHGGNKNKDVEHERHRDGYRNHHGSSNASSSPRRTTHNNDIIYGYDRPPYSRKYENLSSNNETHQPRSKYVRWSSDSSTHHKEYEPPQYGKEMHPTNPKFSTRNTVTSSDFGPQRIPVEEMEERPTSSSGSASFAYEPQASNSPTLEDLDYKTSKEAWGTKPAPESLRPDTPSSQILDPSPELSAVEYSQRFWRNLTNGVASQPHQGQPEESSTSRTAQNQICQDLRAYSPSSNSRDNFSTASSSGYSTLGRSSPPPRQPEYILQETYVDPLPQEDRLRHQGMSGYYSSSPSLPRRSESRSRREREPRESEHYRHHPPHRSEHRPRRQERQDGRSSSRPPRRPDAEGSSGTRYANTTARDYFAGSSRMMYPPQWPFQGQSTRGGFESDRHASRQSQRPEMVDHKSSGTGRNDNHRR